MHLVYENTKEEIIAIKKTPVHRPPHLHNALEIVYVTEGYVQLHYSENIDLNLVAGLVNVTPSHLSNLFKKETGTNFSSYLTDVRMQAAGKLLKSPDMLIYEVAEKTGYSNGGYFGKAFKKYWGVSPEEYKKEKR